MPTESLHNEIRPTIPSLINILHDSDEATQKSAVSALARLAKHGKQWLEIIRGRNNK